MKKSVKKLALNKKTIAVLTNDGLKSVKGGYPTQFTEDSQCPSFKPTDCTTQTNES
ncbi:MAG: hypothetical protein QG657_5296 [Acidobacteriota bacterium]|nr:hypothetical protein [Acidobacteriota bacterium]